MMMQQFDIRPSFLSCFSDASIDTSTTCQLRVVPTATPWALVVFVFAYLLYARWVFAEWERSFSGHRLTRCNEANPSNKQMPDIIP